jgi:NAD(P)-dependent dehydrogenase (short-subunit alcohol dehydrogenase family)
MNQGVAVVTGGASGIGLAIARGLARSGRKVICADVHDGRLAGLEEGLTGVHLDVTDEASVKSLFAGITNLEVLVNSAGIPDGMRMLDELDPSQWRRVLEINLTGCYLTSRAALAQMLPRGGGVIVNVASIAGLAAGRSGAAYTASKFGLIGLTRNIAANYTSRGIRCNAICPGGVTTNISEGVEYGSRAESLRQRDRERPPAIEPEAVVGLAVFLASPEATHINGVAIPVDDGSLAF